jgi:hypothetical protein
MVALALVLAAFLPSKGVLVPNQSLAGVHLRDTPAQVRAAVGTRYSVCKSCASPSWFYFREGTFSGGETGLGVSFRHNRVAAVYTLGYPVGWRTAQGLKVGQDPERMRTLYGRSLRLTECVGYMAYSARGTKAVTTFFTMESFVSGFALTLPSESVCR